MHACMHACMYACAYDRIELRPSTLQKTVVHQSILLQILDWRFRVAYSGTQVIVYMFQCSTEAAENNPQQRETMLLKLTTVQKPRNLKPQSHAAHTPRCNR